MRDAGHRTPDAGHRTSDGEKSKNNISTPQGGGHNYFAKLQVQVQVQVLISRVKYKYFEKLQVQVQVLL